MNSTVIEAEKQWTPPQSERKLLTVREAAKQVRVSERSLFNYTRRGLLPAVKMGRSVRYDPVDVWRFVDAHKVCGEKFVEGSV